MVKYGRIPLFVSNDRFYFLVISTIGEIFSIGKISPRLLVEMTARLELSVISGIKPLNEPISFHSERNSMKRKNLFHYNNIN